MSATRKTEVVDKQYMPESKEIQFRTVVKAYENQQWAKGLKLVEPLLKDFPENGKLISMKAILKYNIDKNVKEAEEGLKRGMMLGRRTSLCWHLYGIFQRSQKKYVEAKKAFHLAYSLDPLNIQILIDLSTLQVQVRDYAGYRVSKQKLMNERSGNATFWTGFIMGAYLDKKYELCLDIISTYMTTIEQKACYQIQELLFLQADCHAMMKNWDKAIETIVNGMKFILNEHKAQELLAYYYLQKQDYNNCRSVINKLISLNHDNQYYYILLECVLLKRPDLWNETSLPSISVSLSKEEKECLVKEYQELFSSFPKSIYLPLVLLSLLEGDDFISFMKKRVYQAIRKGIPSFFQTLLPIITREPGKLTLLRDCCIEAYEKLKSTNQLDVDEEEPFVLFWVTLLLGEIEDYQHHYEQALQYVNEAIEHTPTCCDAYLLKSKIYKHAGYLEQSEQAMEVGYELDKFDRFMNTKCVKSCLKSCNIEKADEVISYWTRQNVPCRIDLESLQACWYELRCGLAYMRRKDYPHAYKLFNNVINHFDTFVTDQFDFHEYVLRKSILTSYASFLHSVDQLYAHRFFKKAAIGALKCAVAVYDNPICKEDYVKHFPLTKASVHKKGAEYTDDKDPDGLTLIMNPQLLDSLQTTVMQLLQFAKNDRECMLCVFEWALRKNNVKLGEEAIENLRIHCNAPLDGMYCMKKLHPDTKSEESIDDSLLHHRLVKAKILLLDTPNASVYDIISSNWKGIKQADIEDCIECYELLNRNDNNKISDFILLAQSFYPGFEETIHCWVHSIVCYTETHISWF